MTRNCGHHVATRWPSCVLHLDGDVDGGDVMRVVAQLDHRGASVVVDEQVVVVAGQDQVDRARREQLVVLLAVGMHDRDHEIGALAPQQPRPARRVVATVGRNCRSSGLDVRGVSSSVAPVSPMRTPSSVTIARSLKPGSGLPSGPRRLAAKSGNFASAMRWKNIALPKSNS